MDQKNEAVKRPVDSLGNEMSDEKWQWFHEFMWRMNQKYGSKIAEEQTPAAKRQRAEA